MTTDSANGTSRTSKILSHGARATNPDGRMPLFDHIKELRNRIVKALLAAVIGSIIGWFTFKYVWNFIQTPYCRLHLSTGIPGHEHEACSLYMTGIFDSLFLHLKIAIITGIVLSSPVWLYQLWAFLAPGLYSRERRWAYFFGGSALPLFGIGGTIAYFAMTKGLHFLLGLVPHNVIPIITINTYLGYALAMLVIFGIAFELPLLFVLLNVVGLLTHERFRKWRRMIIFLIFAFAAVFTPSPDPISMLLLAVPCVVLVEGAEIFAWQHDKRKARRVGAFPGLSDEAIAELAEQDSRSSTEAL
jgi:sec-independent protein translocase protein TatC